MQSGNETILSVRGPWLSSCSCFVVLLSVSAFVRCSQILLHSVISVPDLVLCYLVMSSAVLKFLLLAIICLMIIDGGLCHEEGKTPSTYSRKSLISESQIFSLPNLPDSDIHRCFAVRK